MRVLIYGINYAPELTGIGKYSGEMGAWFAKNKHDVDVITALPYYPEWHVHTHYKGNGWVTELIEGVRVRRAPLYVPSKVTSLTRMLHEFSFVLSSTPYWLTTLFRRRYDVVICVAPAFHLALWGLVYAKLRSVALIYHVQDLQIDAAKDLGMVTNRALLSFLFRMEKLILNHCTKVSTISKGMLKKIQDKGVSSSKCVLFPNWVDEYYVRPMSRVDSLRTTFGLKDTDKVVMYSGALGEKQGLELIIDVARSLRHYESLHFLIVGSGGAECKLKEMVDNYSLTNVRFYPLQPYDKLSAMLGAADVHLVLQKKSASDLVMPSKLTTILAAGGCSIVTAMPGTTLYETISTHQLGLLIEPESVDALQTGIKKALHSNLDVYRRNARSYAEKYLGREAILKEFEKELRQLVNRFELKVEAHDALPDYADSHTLSKPAFSEEAGGGQP